MRGTGKMGAALGNISNVGDFDDEYGGYELVSEPSVDSETGAFDSGQYTASDVGLAPPVIRNPAQSGIDVNKLVSFAGQLFRYQAGTDAYGRRVFTPKRVGQAGALPGWLLPVGAAVVILGVILRS